MSGRARQVAAIVAGSSVYVVATYTGYMYFQMSRKERATMETLQDTTLHGKTVSHVDNPLRSQTFNDIAKVYDDEIGRDEVFMGINLLRRWMLYFHARGTVLEVGAGTGRNITYYPKAVRRVVLSDASNEMLQQAKHKIQELPSEEQKRFALLQVDAKALQTDTISLPDHAFDTVVDTFGLCSYDDPVAVLKEMARTCKSPHGRILLLEHGRSKSFDFVTNYLDTHAERHAAHWGCVWNRDLDGILDECEKQGFLTVETKRTWHFGTTYYVVCRPT
jgi:methyltransferase OMS1